MIEYIIVLIIMYLIYEIILLLCIIRNKYKNAYLQLSITIITFVNITE